MFDLLRKEIDTLPTPTAGRALLIVDDDDGLLKWKLEDGTVRVAPLAYMLLRDQKAAGTNGGAFNSGSWVTRDLNTEAVDVAGNVALNNGGAGPGILLDGGTYRTRILVPGFLVNGHKARLRNTTDGSTVLVGTTEYSYSGGFVTNHSVIEGRFTIAAGKTLEVQHQCEATHSPDGLGHASGFGEVEVFTTVALWREAG